MHTRTQLFVLLILFSLISNAAQTFPVTDEQVCPRQSSDIIQYVERQASEIDASQVPRDLFNANEGGKFGWEAKLLGMINKKLDKWLWSWMPSSMSDKLTALRLKFNEMMRESLAKIALLAVEGMPIRHAMLIVKGILAKYLVPLAKDVSPELAENMSQLVGDDDMFDEKTGEKKESSNVPRADENFAEEESEAHPSAKMVNVAVAAAKDLLGDIRVGKYDKNVDGGKTFADSAIGKRLNGLRNKLLALLTGMLSKSTAMSLFMAFAKMPEILKEKNAATWGWMAKCAHDKVDGGANVEPMAGEEIKEMAVETVQNTVVAHGMHGSAGQSGTDLFPHRRVKRRAFACCFPDTMFGHHYSTTSAVGYVAFIGYNMGLFISGFTFYFLTKLFWQSTDPYLHVGRSWVMNPGPHWCGGPKCARPYAVALGVLGTFGLIFLALLPYLNIY